MADPVVVRSPSLRVVESLQIGVQRDLEMMGHRLEANERGRAAKLVRTFSDALDDQFVPVVLEAGPGGAEIVEMGTCPQETCLFFTQIDLEAIGISYADAVWIPELGLIAVDAERDTHDGFLTYVMVHELWHVVASAMRASGVQTPRSLAWFHASESGEDATAFLLEGWLLNQVTDGAYYREIRRLKRVVSLGQRETVQAAGVVYTPMSPTLETLFAAQGIRPTDSARDQFAALATFDLNRHLAGAGTVTTADLPQIEQVYDQMLRGFEQNPQAWRLVDSSAP